MSNKRVWIRATLALVIVWAAVISIRSYAGSKRVTASKVEETIQEVDFSDWSERVPDGVQPEDRADELERVAAMFNRLDFNEREIAQDRRIAEKFYSLLSDPEKEQFLSLTLARSMEESMRALNAMPKEDRHRFVERALANIESGRTAEEMERTRDISEKLLAQITTEGMKAYYKEANAETKLDLAEVVAEMDAIIKGMDGPEMGPGAR